MSICVNTKSEIFKETAKRLDINEASLEEIVHKYINTEGNVDSFPSDYYVLSRVNGVPLTNLSEDAIKLINKKYSKPIVADTYEDAQAVVTDMSQYFDPKHIGLKQTYDGKYQVTLAVNHTPIKEQYKGKLIFAQSGTGKSRIADNVNVIDADILLAETLGTSVEAASFVFNNLDIKQKLAISKEYHNRIREEVGKGHTVLTASQAMLEEADAVFYNESPELTNARTSAEDREGSNKYSNTEKALSDILKASSLKGKEVVSLDSEHFLSDYLLTNPEYKTPTDYNKYAESLTDAVNTFLKDFNLTVHNLESYEGDLPLFDAVNRVINAKKASDVTDAMGYAVAFVMQQEPSLRNIIIRDAINNLVPGLQRAASEDFVNRIITNDNEKSIKVPIGLAKVLGRKYVRPSEIYAHIPGKQQALKNLGKEIAQTLRDYYDGKDPKNFIQRAWDIIKEFFNKVTHNGYYQERMDFINMAADAIIRKDPTFVKGPEYKIGSRTRASLVDLEKAFREFPFEQSIVKALSDKNIALAGSASIRLAGTLYRPAENPLHDIDFQVQGIRSKEELTALLEDTFHHIKHFRSIRSKDNTNEYTESYVLLDRDFHLEKGEEGYLSIIDEETNEVIATVNLHTNEIEDVKVPELQHKLLDFFINTKEDSGYGNYSLTINGDEYVVNDARNAFDAKVRWQRRKDLWDWARFAPNENYLRGGENTAFNISGKSLREFLRDKGLIHAYDPSIGDSDSKSMYVTKGDGTYSLRAKVNEIYTILRQNNIPIDAVDFKLTKAKTALRVVFNDSQDAIFRMTDKDTKNVSKVVDFLQARIPSLKGRVHFATLEEARTALGRELKKNESSFIKGGQVYLVGRRFNQDIAIEECLHPFTATLKYENPFLYNRLAEEAMVSFPKLWEEVVANYTSTDGFTAEDRVNELLTQALSRAFREEFNNNKHKTFSDYVKEFITWFKNLFYRVNPVTGNQIIDLDTLSPRMKLADLAELINTSDTEFSVSFEEKTRFNKERANIAPEDANFITESIVIPGISKESVREVSTLWKEAREQFDSAELVTMPYSEWRNLGTTIPVYNHTVSYKGRAANDVPMTSSIGAVIKVLSDENSGWDDFYTTYYKYDKANKTITLPKYAVSLAKLATHGNEFLSQLAQELNTYGYEFDKYSWNAVEMFDCLLSGEQLSLEDFLSDIGGEYYYEDSRQGNLFDEFGNPTETKTQEEGLTTPEKEAVRPELRLFQEQTSKMVEQLTNLLDSDLMSNAEVRHVAEQAVYFISDSITEFLEDPSKIFNAFPKLGIKDGKPMTEAEKKEEIERIKKMSRVELAKYLTPERLTLLVKDRLFTPPSQTDHVVNADSVEINTPGNSNINNLTLMRKANLIRNNFDAVVRFAYDTFATVENFTITSIEDALTIQEDVVLSEDDIEIDNDIDTIIEGGESLQEHWQIISRTLDVLTSMSQLVKSALNRCFQIQVVDGKEQHVPSDFGVAERVSAKDATASILRWTRGAESLSHMVEMLKAKEQENPWIKQITSRLEDTSGKEADFQSQFYGVFAKAFQPYSVVLKEYNEKTGQFEYKSIQVNQHPALTEVTQSIDVAFKTNTHPMFDNMELRKDVVETFTAISNDLVNRAQKSLEENNRAEVVDLITKAVNALGYAVDASTVNTSLDSTKTFNTIVKNLSDIANHLNAALGQKNYEPFKYGTENSIGGFLSKVLGILTERLEETAVSSFYDSGKMYQSNVTPSYLTVLMNHLTADEARFREFVEGEYGQYEWFRSADGTWRNEWLRVLTSFKNQEDRKDLFKHKVQLNFNKHNYMKNMSDIEYGLSVITEFVTDIANAKGYRVPAWYRIPMLSNKPSSEFVRMYAYVGDMMKPKLLEGFNMIFLQELSRIQTIDIRNYNKSNPNFIKNFDKNGRKFAMLTFLNDYLEGGKQVNSELGKLINKAIKEGTEKLSAEENAQMNSLVNKEIEKMMDARADTIINEWKANGIFEGVKKIANFGTDDTVVETKLREFIWNDTFAAMNILELTITDPAFYKDAEDLQKRLAQIHAPGTRANVEATDYEGNSVTDGKFRTILLKDFDNFVSNIKDNLRIVFDKKLKELEGRGITKEDGSYKAAAATYENIINQFDKINVADAQGYSSPTSYRKKAFIFGRWSRGAEEIYKKLLSNNYNLTDLETAFQPLKPFVYGQIGKPGVVNREGVTPPLSKLKVPVQFKNSEYLLIMADAILRGEDTGRPNLLRAIYDVMEESAVRNPKRGLDTVQFESTCKSGLMAPIDIKQFSNSKGGETQAKLALESAIYNEDGSYNSDTYVYEVPFEYYAIQQEVPGHFREHKQAHGSQIRYIIPTDLETVDSDGNPVRYEFFDRGEKKSLTDEEFKREYEENIYQNIEESLNELSKQLGIGGYEISKKDRNIALSKVLLKEIWSSPRYGTDLAIACTVNNTTGEFNIPLGDPIQAKRVEQLINSIVKNRVNKQEVAGGPIVQVTNFGTSKELNIRFKSKNGGLLMTKAEFAKTAPNNGKSYDIDAAYRKYIEKNQAGIDHYEVFVSAFSNELFEKFTDKAGNIDIEAIEVINPDLLKMIGYRIPTEDKYSMAPLKIVGFLPKEAGDAIMLPNDITLLTGSDFDVDKFYIMRKEYNITSRVGAPESLTKENFDTATREYIKGHQDQIYKHLRNVLNQESSGELSSQILLSEEEEAAITERVNNTIDQKIESENRRHADALDRIAEDTSDAYYATEESKERGSIVEGQEERAEALVQRGENKQLRYENKRHETRLNTLALEREEKTAAALKKGREKKVNNIINNFLNEGAFNTKGGDAMFRTLKEAYIKYMFDYVEPTEGRTYRNNKIIDMSWAVLTNETTASKMLTPGGFEPEKTLGYMISAFQNPANSEYTWEQMEQIANGTKGLLEENGKRKLVDYDPTNDDIETGVSALKSLCYTEKNLCFIDTHLQFYKQNSAAATALGMAAVQKVAHAVLESNGFYLDISEITNTDNFVLAGKSFSGLMEIDTKLNNEGNLIGRTLGEFVAMFADAVKDPVANLMNINNTTMPIVTALIRLGVPLKSVALFISQPIIKEVLNLYNSENITNFVRLSDIINKEIERIEKDINPEENSVLKELNEITEEELVLGLRSFDDVRNYKILKFFKNFSAIADAFKSPTYATRFNSISNSVGPQVIDNLTMEYKADNGNFNNFYIYDESSDSFKAASFDTILSAHPILRGFYKTLALSKDLLEDMPINSDHFRNMLNNADEDMSNDMMRILYSDRKTLSELGDFYQSYLLIASGAIPLEATPQNKYQGLKYYIEQFPADFMRGNAKEIFKGNALIDAIRLDIQKGRAILRVDVAGLKTQDKERFGDAWVDLYNSGERGRKLAEHLFYYNFWRTGVGFSPKSFMNLFPTRLKSKIKGYNETFVVHANDYGANAIGQIILEQFVRNNADNSKLAPRVTFGREGLNPTMDTAENYVFSGKDFQNIANKPYVKVKIGGADVLLKRVAKNDKGQVAYYKKLGLLGNNGEFFEASLDRNYRSIMSTSSVKEQNNEGQTQEVTGVQQETNDAPVHTVNTVEEQKRNSEELKNMLLTAFMASGKTKEEAEAKITEFKNKAEQEKKALKSPMKKWMRTKFTQLQMKFDEELLEDLYNELC